MFEGIHKIVTFPVTFQCHALLCTVQSSAELEQSGWNLQNKIYEAHIQKYKSMADWLTDWLTGWLADWLTGWLADWLTEFLIN